MTAVVLPVDLEAWAEAEVSAGRAESVEQVAARAIRGYRYSVEELRASLDAAEREADEVGWLSAEEVFDSIEAELLKEIEAEEQAAAQST
jgi:hypothetical protein